MKRSKTKMRGKIWIFGSEFSLQILANAPFIRSKGYLYFVNKQILMVIKKQKKNLFPINGINKALIRRQKLILKGSAKARNG